VRNDVQWYAALTMPKFFVSCVLFCEKVMKLHTVRCCMLSCLCLPLVGATADIAWSQGKVTSLSSHDMHETGIAKEMIVYIATLQDGSVALFHYTKPVFIPSPIALGKTFEYSLRTNRLMWVKDPGRRKPNSYVRMTIDSMAVAP
jgi:hypothetical protein